MLLFLRQCVMKMRTHTITDQNENLFASACIRVRQAPVWRQALALTLERVLTTTIHLFWLLGQNLHSTKEVDDGKTPANSKDRR
jgi:hypothetical protein